MLFDSGGFPAEIAIMIGKFETTLLQLCQRINNKIRTLITLFAERLCSVVVVICSGSGRRGRPGRPRRTVNRADG